MWWPFVCRPRGRATSYLFEYSSLPVLRLLCGHVCLRKCFDQTDILTHHTDTKNGFRSTWCFGVAALLLVSDFRFYFYHLHARNIYYHRTQIIFKTIGIIYSQILQQRLNNSNVPSPTLKVFIHSIRQFLTSLHKRESSCLRSRTAPHWRLRSSLIRSFAKTKLHAPFLTGRFFRWVGL